MAGHLQVFDVLGEHTNRELLRLAVAQREFFTPSRNSPSKHYPDWRRSTVIYDHQFAQHAALLEHVVMSRLPEVLSGLGIAAFDVASVEIQLTSHNDGQYYRWHTDNSTPQTASRTVTFVYYFSVEPRRFAGGELQIHGPDAATIEPVNDSIVFFASAARHEVKPVICQSGRFEDGRFTVNGWVRRRTPVPQPELRGGYFDQKIFGPLARRTDPIAPRTLTGSRPVAASLADAQPQTDATRSEALLEMYAQLHRQSGQSRRIRERSQVSRDEFYERHYFANRPLVLRGVASDSPAVRSWSPEYLAARQGEVVVECTSGRDLDPDYELNYRDTVTTMTLSEFVARIREPGSGKRLYLVARNHFFDLPALAALREELQPPAHLVDTRVRSRGSVKLWMGGADTVTPLHHDQHSIFFMQIFGRKRIKMIPPFDFSRLYVRERFYSEVNPERVDPVRHPLFAQVSLASVELGPGDALFIPVGWWHHVRSLQACISATFSAFHIEGGNTRLLTAR
jgi:Cupin-like domain/2OG-Fe(II) oxygenase superfamily